MCDHWCYSWGFFPRCEFSQLPCGRFEQQWEILHLQKTKISRTKLMKDAGIQFNNEIIIYIIFNGVLPNFVMLNVIIWFIYTECGNWQCCQSTSMQSTDKQRVRVYSVCFFFLKSCTLLDPSQLQHLLHLYFATSQFYRTFIPVSVSLWNDLADSVIDGVRQVGFKSRANAFLSS